MVTTQIKNKIVSNVRTLFNTITVAKKKESVSEDVNSLMFVVMNGKTTDESIVTKKMFDAVFERELNKRMEEANNELISINKFLNR
jgi:hypothetical protein